jgi:hypothetical protein
VVPTLEPEKSQNTPGRKYTDTLELRLRALTTIAGNGSNPDQLALQIVQGRKDERDGKGRPVLVLMHGIHLVDMLTPAQTIHELRILGTPSLWDEQRHGPTQHLNGLVAVEAVCSSIPTRDDPLWRLTDDSVLRGIDDGKQTS